MDPLITAIIQWASSQGIGVAMLLFAIYWLNKANAKAASAATTERNARLNLLEKSMETLALRVAECEKDRTGLWKQLVEIAHRQGHNVADIEQLKSTESK